MIEKSLPITEKLLVSGLKATQQLFELLTQEAEQLKNLQNPERLSQIAIDKRTSAGQLEQFSKQMSQVLNTEQLSLSQEGVAQYLSKAEHAGLNVREARRCWQSICELGPKCRNLNEQNGATIGLLSRHTQRALQILRGKSPLATTYGPDGSTRNELYSHSLVSV